jgi:mannose-6-phosphate isomerase
MAAVRRPIRLAYNPVYRGYLGGLRTQRFRGMPEPVDSLWSEDWVGSCTLSGSAASGQDLQGLSLIDGNGVGSATLRSLVEALPEEMLGSAAVVQDPADIGLLVKLNAPAGPAPLHGHPDRAFAARHLGSPYGKAETWIILEADPTGANVPYAGVGLRDGVTELDFRAAMERRDSEGLRAMLHRIDLCAGDVWLMHPRVPHCLGPGLLFIEVQEPSDHIVIPEWWSVGADEATATMGLGWDLALSMLDLTPSSREASLSAARQRPTTLLRHRGSTETRLLNADGLDFFDVHQLDVEDELSIDDGRFAIDVVTAGDGWVEGDFGREQIRRGETFAMAASVPHMFTADRTSLQVVRCLGPAGARDLSEH